MQKQLESNVQVHSLFWYGLGGAICGIAALAAGLIILCQTDMDAMSGGGLIGGFKLMIIHNKLCWHLFFSLLSPIAIVLGLIGFAKSVRHHIKSSGKQLSVLAILFGVSNILLVGGITLPKMRKVKLEAKLQIARMRLYQEDMQTDSELTEINKAAKLHVINLKSSDWSIRSKAAIALGEMRDANAVELLITVLKKDKVDNVRNDAAEALGMIGDTRAVEPLIAALKDEEQNVRKKAMEALAKIGDTRAVEPLVAALRDEDEFVRKSAVEALGEIRDTRAIEPLIAALKDESWVVSNSAEEALEKLGWQAED